MLSARAKNQGGGSLCVLSSQRRDWLAKRRGDLPAMDERAGRVVLAKQWVKTRVPVGTRLVSVDSAVWRNLCDGHRAAFAAGDAR